MGNVSEHFDRSEFACSCGCGFDVVDPRLLANMEKIREHFGKPMIIHCVCRCAKNNKKNGGASKSQHLFAKAVDFHIKGMDSLEDNREIAHWIDEYITTNDCGIGIYSWGVHFDIREKMARWDNTHG
jgi:uncharacterized protein YcbK (DUF882 family)